MWTAVVGGLTQRKATRRSAASSQSETKPRTSPRNAVRMESLRRAAAGVGLAVTVQDTRGSSLRRKGTVSDERIFPNAQGDFFELREVLLPKLDGPLAFDLAEHLQGVSTHVPAGADAIGQTRAWGTRWIDVGERQRHRSTFRWVLVCAAEPVYWQACSGLCESSFGWGCW